MYEMVTSKEINGGDTGKRNLSRKKIHPVAELPWDVYGRAGSWALYGDESIYRFGGFKCDEDKGGTYVVTDLVKHRISDLDPPSSWETVSSSMRVPRSTPFVTTVGRKLYVVAGEEHWTDDDDDHISRPLRWTSRDQFCSKANWNMCGEVFDLEDKTWEYLPQDFIHFNGCDCRQAALVEQDGPGDIVFYNLYLGSMLFFDVTSGDLLPFNHYSFVLWTVPRPKGLEDCKNIFPLEYATRNAQAVFTNKTFYWFAYDLHLYAYDMDSLSWFRSPSLEDKLPPLNSRASLLSPFWFAWEMGSFW